MAMNEGVERGRPDPERPEKPLSPQPPGGEGDAEIEGLLSAFASGDASALGPLIARMTPRMKQRIRGRIPGPLRSRLDSGDVIQEVAMEVLAMCPRFEDQGPTAFQSLLNRISEGVIANLLARERARKRRPAGNPLRAKEGSASTTFDPLRGIAGNGPTPSEAAWKAEKVDAMKRCLGLLSPEEREVLQLIEYQGLDHKQVGERLGITCEASRKRHSRTIARLRKLMKDVGIS